AGLEADGVHGAVHLGHAEDLLDLVLRVPLGHVDGLAAEAAGLLQPFLVQVADDDDGGAEQEGRARRGQPDRARAGDVDGRARPHPGAHTAVVPRREDVREHGQVENFLHRLVLVGELQQVPVGVRHQDVLGLAAYPAAHVDVAVGRAGAVRVDVLADARLAFLAVAAAAAGDVERHGHQVAGLDELDAGTGVDHLAGDLATEDEARRGRGTAAHHVLVAAADVRRDRLEDRRVGQFAAHVGRVHTRTVLQLVVGVGGLAYLDLAGTLVGDSSVTGHGLSLRWYGVRMADRQAVRRSPPLAGAPPSAAASQPLAELVVARVTGERNLPGGLP